MFRIIQRRYWYFGLSLAVIIAGLISISVNGIPLSIDFTGGTIYDLEFERADVGEFEIRDVYDELGIEDVKVVQATSETGSRFLVRSKPIPDTIVAAGEAAGEEGGAQATQSRKEVLAAALESEIGPFEELRFESIGAAVGELVTRNATLAVALASIAVALYLIVMFRHLSHPGRYGICTIIALIHDVLITLGLASLMGALFGWEVDALFLTALLTIIGFSVHDSIVVFDRIRENAGRMRGLSYESLVNHSVIQTLDRSINTQLTALFTLVAIYAFSQGQLERFLFWLIIGLISGTYSSIFTAAPALVVWENREWQRWFGGRRTKATA
jgi:preprotein translocase subunit SecF